MSELLEAALRYLPRTIPIASGSKRPSVGEGWPTWPATRESVTAHYAERPEDGVGVRTGKGLVVLDVDRRSGGYESLARLEREHGPRPASPEVVTGADGRHHYYRAPRAVASKTIAPGLEIKAAGCQVIAPPSIHPDTGRLYVWHPAHPLIEREIPPLPVWLARLAGHDRPAEAYVELGDLAERDPLHRIPSERYVDKLAGRSIDRHGYITCPFHGENMPSLKVYRGGGWKCYGCGAGGRIYQFAALLGGWQLPLTVAVRREIRAELICIFAEELAA